MSNRLDPRKLPAYSISEAAHYLNIPSSTVRYWCVGRDQYNGLIQPAEIDPIVLLSFLNLVELHVVGVIRRKHKIPFIKIRSAVDYIEEQFSSKNPIISHQFQTDGVDLFIHHLGELVNISKDGQLAIRGLLDAALKRIDRDPKGVPIRLYPFTRTEVTGVPATIVIDPTLSAGRPVISGSGIATEIVAERYKAGESIRHLARDYGRKEAEIEEAIRCELTTAA